MEARVPKSFKVFGDTVKVYFNNQLCNELQLYGQARYDERKIILSTTRGIDKLAVAQIEQTFYHEKIHILLEALNKRELSADEEFVDTFASLLRESDLSTKY